MTSVQLTAMDSVRRARMACGKGVVAQSSPDGFIWQQLNQALLHENQLPLLRLKYGKKDVMEVTSSMRDSCAQVLRCLKVWYDVPPECWFLAVNTMDRFLAKMKVRPKHLSCMAVSCFHLAIKLMANKSPTAATTGNGNIAVNAEDMLNISQAQCTASDMTRMQQIIVNKLNCDLATITPLHFVTLFCAIYDMNKPTGYPTINREAILLKLEILACNYECAEFRSCILALSLFSCVLEALYISAGLETMELMLFIASLQNFCVIADGELYKCRQVSLAVLDYYDQQQQFPLSQKQQLIWKLSRRTILQLKPTARITSVLPTIEETNLLKFSNIRNRHDSDSDGMGGSEIAEGEEEEELAEEDEENYWETLGLWRIGTTLEQ